MTKSTAFKLIGAVLVALVAIAAYELLRTAIEPRVERRIAEIGLTSNEKAV